MVIRVDGFLQRQIGTARMRIWLVSPQRPGIGWFHDVDFTQSIREELDKLPEGMPRQWGPFEQKFFGDTLEVIPELSALLDEYKLDKDFEVGTPPDFTSIEGQFPVVS